MSLLASGIGTFLQSNRVWGIGAGMICMPCPYGLDIPAILLHYNRCINEGNVPQSSQDENYREARRAFLIGYDRSVPRLRQANRCTGCGQCNPHCPQGIDIPAKLQEIDRFVEALKQETL
jgi:predicted aldo/keto reductase-like oxidoreductase